MSLVRLTAPEEARRFRARRAAGRAALGLVPTMGALHEGHLSLVRRAAAENELVAVSIFVNPLQFDDPGDLERYPRDFEGDARLLESAGAGLAFTGTLEQFFPEASSAEEIVSADPGPDARVLEGVHLRGHFNGVATIVRRLVQLQPPRPPYLRGQPL